MTIDEAKEFIRWGYDLGHRYCSDHQNWPPPWPNDTIRDAGPFRDTLELQLLGEVVSRASRGQSHAQIEEWVKSVVDPAPPETGNCLPQTSASVAHAGPTSIPAIATGSSRSAW